MADLQALDLGQTRLGGALVGDFQQVLSGCHFGKDFARSLSFRGVPVSAGPNGRRHVEGVVPRREKFERLSGAVRRGENLDRLQRLVHRTVDGVPEDDEPCRMHLRARGECLRSISISGPAILTVPD